MKNNARLGMTLTAALAAIVVCSAVTLAQSVSSKESGAVQPSFMQPAKSIEKLSCSKTLDIVTMRTVANKIISVPWRVGDKDKQPDHCVHGSAAPVKWGWQDEFGVPYKWGGLDDEKVFAAKHEKLMSAGLHPFDDPKAKACTTGVDCSGLASIAWGLPTKHTTSENDKWSSLLAFAEQFDVLYDADHDKLLPRWFDHVNPGDLLVVPSHTYTKGDPRPATNGHVLVVSDISDSGKVCIFEASGHREVWEKDTGKELWLDWTAQPREIDADFLESDMPGRTWVVWHWCGKVEYSTRGGPSYSCATPLRFPDDHYSDKKPTTPPKQHHEDVKATH